MYFLATHPFFYSSSCMYIHCGFWRGHRLLGDLSARLPVNQWAISIYQEDWYRSASGNLSISLYIYSPVPGRRVSGSVSGGATRSFKLPRCSYREISLAPRSSRLKSLRLHKGAVRSRWLREGNFALDFILFLSLCLYGALRYTQCTHAASLITDPDRIWVEENLSVAVQECGRARARPMQGR